ncbi:MAG: cupin domain-containing protein [Ktedonobacterales bacterium]|nr:cupin domain-containing protein [Ktedonobacterales bacterium]
MQIYNLTQINASQSPLDKAYLEFLRVPTMSLGVYRLPAGGEDPQQPHTEDEAYHVISGRGMIRVGEEDQPIAAGAVVYVPTNVPHRFHAITEDLVILVMFAPAEYTNR